MLATAERIARRAHAGQVDLAGNDYIRHVERVVAMVEGDDAKAVAWLHDVIEDTGLTGADLLADGIPPHVIEAVVLLTKPPKGSPNRPNYADYVTSLLVAGNPLAIAVKIADLRDHLDPHCPPRLRPRYESALRVLGAEATA